MPNQLRAYKASVFQALAHPTRIAIIEILRDGEVSAGALLEQLDVEQANLSQHLTVLRNKQIVVNRKEGNQVFYSLRNPVLGESPRPDAPLLPGGPERHDPDAGRSEP